MELGTRMDTRTARRIRAAGGMAFLVILMTGALLFTASVSAQDGQGDETTQETDEQQAGAALDEPQAPEDCLECHRFISADVVSSWEIQDHGQNDVGCPVCHRTHVANFRPEPSASVCMDCHDVLAVHPDVSPEDEAGTCMECHAGIIHLPPGQGSWLESGLPPERLTEDPRPASTISESEAQITAVIVVILGIVTGIIVGFVLDRFVRNL